MGTSKQYGGRSLVPAFVDGAGSDAPAGFGAGIGGAAPDAPGGGADGGAPPTLPMAAFNGSFTSARRHFNSYVRTGDRGSLARAAASYVRNGAGGGARAARSMGVARAAGGRLLGFIRDFQRQGPTESLQRFNLQHLAGQPARQVLVSVLEFICLPGGPIDEGLARDAMLDAIGNMADDGLTDFDQLSAAQLHELFLDFVARTIEGRILADMGNQNLTVPDEVAAVINVQEQAHDFIRGCIQMDGTGMNRAVNMTDQEMSGFVTRIYEATFALIQNLGDGV